MSNGIIIKSKEEVEIMARAGKILAQILDRLKKEARPGVKTRELNKKAEELIKSFKVEPAFLDYDGFPAVLCTSVNDVIVHEVPSDYKLKKGDILSLDLGIRYKGYFADMAVTMPVDEISDETKRLIRVTRKALKRGIKKTRPGNTIGDIGNTIQRYIEKRGFCVVKELCGHGIGKDLHEEPEILNYGKRKKGPVLKEGMVLCLEPMAAIGTGEIKRAKDGCGYATDDGSLSAHFEHMIVVTKDGNRVLTRHL